MVVVVVVKGGYEGYGGNDVGNFDNSESFWDTDLEGGEFWDSEDGEGGCFGRDDEEEGSPISLIWMAFEAYKNEFRYEGLGHLMHKVDGTRAGVGEVLRSRMSWMMAKNTLLREAAPIPRLYPE